MPIVRFPIVGGLNTFINPLAKKDGDLLRAVNVDSYPFGAIRKRPGYETFLGTADGSTVTTLFSWTKNDGSLFLYRKSGTKLYFSTEGTGVWTVCGNGTVTGEHIGRAVLDDTLIFGDGVGSTRHTTSGTSFTNTVLAPVGEFFTQYQNRIYLAGTSSTMFFSSAGDATDWALSAPSDSSSFSVPGAGKLGQTFVAADRLIATKSSGRVLRWDGFSLVDLATSKGPSSPYSVATSEGFYFYLNEEGINGYGGLRPELISNAINSQMANNAGSGVPGANLGTAPGEVQNEAYYVAVGTITDDIVNETINDAVVKYDFRRNEFTNYSFNDFPSTFHAFKDTTGLPQLIFGGADGQVMKLNGTKHSDNGIAIPCLIEFVLTLGVPETSKEWKKLWMFFNPGNQAQVQVAFADTYRRDSLKWKEIGDAHDGVLEARFPAGSRSKFMFVRIYESSPTADFKYYGMSVDALGVPERK